ncbi:hypothetical protein STEG23_005466, partial [Scotinomys teguina]
RRTRQVEVPPRSVDAPYHRYPIQLYQEKRDFGITAAIVTAVALAASAAAVAGFALAKQRAAYIHRLTLRACEVTSRECGRLERQHIAKNSYIVVDSQVCGRCNRFVLCE